MGPASCRRSCSYWISCILLVLWTVVLRRVGALVPTGYLVSFWYCGPWVLRRVGALVPTGYLVSFWYCGPWVLRRVGALVPTGYLVSFLYCGLWVLRWRCTLVLLDSYQDKAVSRNVFLLRSCPWECLPSRRLVLQDRNVILLGVPSFSLGKSFFLWPSVHQCIDSLMDRWQLLLLLVELVSILIAWWTDSSCSSTRVHKCLGGPMDRYHCVSLAEEYFLVSRECFPSCVLCPQAEEHFLSWCLMTEEHPRLDVCFSGVLFLWCQGTFYREECLSSLCPVSACWWTLRRNVSFLLSPLSPYIGGKWLPPLQTGMTVSDEGWPPRWQWVTTGLASPDSAGSLPSNIYNICRANCRLMWQRLSRQSSSVSDYWARCSGHGRLEPPLLRQTLLVVLRLLGDGRPGDCRSRGSEVCCYCGSCCSCSCCSSFYSCSCSCSCSSSYSFSCSYSCSSCFSCCSMPVKGDGQVLLTGWLPDYCPGFPPSSSIPVSWATSGVEVTNSWWAWWVLCILFTATPSSTGCCRRLAALQPRPLWRALHSAPRSGRRGVKSWRCRTSVCSPQTDCVVRK